jgi:hypothetical protein
MLSVEYVTTRGALNGGKLMIVTLDLFAYLVFLFFL